MSTAPNTLDLSIGRLAREGGVPVSTVRYYERIGLLSPRARTESGYRQYGDEELERLRFVKLAQSLGFTLEDAALLLDLRENVPVARPQVEELIRTRLDKVREQIVHLQEVECLMEAALSKCEKECISDKCAVLEEFQEKLGGEFQKCP